LAIFGAVADTRKAREDDQALTQKPKCLSLQLYPGSSLAVLVQSGIALAFDILRRRTS
jgi:hypothetical protein